MADKEVTTNALFADIDSTVLIAHRIEAMLAGVNQLLEAASDNGIDDSEGSIWHSLQLVKAAKEESAKIYWQADDLHLSERAKKLEGVAALV